MRGIWRGFIAKDRAADKFLMGEIDANFQESTATFTSVDGTK
jgi:hypothetical protein